MRTFVKSKSRRIEMEHKFKKLLLTSYMCFSMVLFRRLLVNRGMLNLSKLDLTTVLCDDRGGVELRRLQRELRDGRDAICRDPNLVNRECVAKAYDSGIALLPEIWRLEQRK